MPLYDASGNELVAGPSPQVVVQQMLGGARRAPSPGRKPQLIQLASLTASALVSAPPTGASSPSAGPIQPVGQYLEALLWAVIVGGTGTPAGLPTGGAFTYTVDGQSYGQVECQNDSTQAPLGYPRVLVPLARGLADGPHTLVLTVSVAGPVAIDSFLVVVFGGVGNLWGTLVAAFSLGIANKFLEPFAGAVLGKIAILVFIILFIQKRPRGLFALKGRAVEA